MTILDNIKATNGSLTCDRYWENSSSILAKHSRFEGIPENLLLNFSSCVVSE